MTGGTTASGSRSGRSRRDFLGQTAIALSGMVAAASGVTASLYLAGPALSAGGTTTADGAWSVVPGARPLFDNGPVRHSITVTSSAGWAIASSTQGIFLDASEGGEPRAFSARCPHEGCLIDWEASRGLYLCPCHDSEFTRDGACMFGPAKRGLDPLDVRTAADGEIEVRYRLFALDTTERIIVG